MFLFQLGIAISAFFMLVHSQTCICDLIEGICEVNCCCDADCSASDIQTFSTCLNKAYVQNDLLCVYDQIVFVNNIPTAVEVKQDGLFCLQTDNFFSRNNYTTPVTCTSNTCFDVSVSSTFSYELASTPVVTTTEIYTSGDTISVIGSSGAIGVFSLPGVNGIANACQNLNPVQYLYDSSQKCTQILQSLSISCNSDLSLDATFYSQGFKFAPSPAVLALALNITNTSDHYNFEQLLNISECTGCSIQPIYNSTSGVCFNVVTSINYVLFTNGTSGISSVNLNIGLTNIDDTNLPLQQTFSVEFRGITNNGTVIPRSGNPGYILGKPMIWAQNGSSGFESSITNAGIGPLLLPASGQCDNSNGIPIYFGENMISGCTIALNRNLSNTCSLVQAEINSIMSQYMPDLTANPTYAAAFGNSPVSELDVSTVSPNWIQLFSAGDQSNISPEVDGGCNIVTDAELEILYAYTGALSDPQAKIVGVRYQFNTPQLITFRCLGTICDSTSTQLLQVTSSVTFTDVSATPISINMQQPTINIRLPSDFFFPFKGSASSFNLSIFCSCCSFLAVLFHILL